MKKRLKIIIPLCIAAAALLMLAYQFGTINLKNVLRSNWGIQPLPALSHVEYSESSQFFGGDGSCYYVVRYRGGFSLKELADENSDRYVYGDTVSEADRQVMYEILDELQMDSMKLRYNYLNGQEYLRNGRADMESTTVGRNLYIINNTEDHLLYIVVHYS